MSVAWGKTDTGTMVEDLHPCPYCKAERERKRQECNAAVEWWLNQLTDDNRMKILVEQYRAYRAYLGFKFGAKK